MNKMIKSPGCAAARTIQAGYPVKGTGARSAYNDISFKHKKNNCQQSYNSQINSKLKPGKGKFIFKSSIIFRSDFFKHIL